MSSIVVVGCILASAIAFQIFKIEAKTYYFNVNKTNNEFMIYNRANTNYSAHNYQSGVYMSELRNNVTRKRNSTIVRQMHPILDPEWNYNCSNITRSKLPTYILKYYEAVSKDMTGPIRILFNTMSQNSTIIRFNLSDVTVNEIISDVELHFYYPVEKNLSQKSLILRLYQVENHYFNETTLINPDAHKLLNVIYILQAESGWQVFKLTNAIHSWLKTKQDLLLLITVSKPNEEQFSIFKDKNREALRTFMTLEFQSEKNGCKTEGPNAIQTDSCRKHDLYIDFEKLNWKKFIISPSGYHAFQCVGRCFTRDNLPNHSKVTSSLPDISRKSLCCTPTEYSPLPIMFYDKNGNIIIKMYDEMIVSACGCR